MPTPVEDRVSPGYRAARAIGRLLVQAYYPDLVVEGAERLPAGPLVVAANHPNSLIDPVVLSVSLPRRIHWLAKATLFESGIGRLLLTSLGAIPVHRRHEGGTRDTTALLLRTAADALLEGKAIGIFPEGKSHDALRLAELKSGAARMTLLAARDLAAAGRREGVHVAPVVLHFPEKTRFRSGAVVIVGEPIEVRVTDTPEAITENVRRRIEEILVHVDDAQQEALLRAVSVLVRRRRSLGGGQLDARDHHFVDREIAAAIRRFSRDEPERVEAFRQRLVAYVDRLDRSGFSLHALEPEPGSTHRVLLATALLPVAAWGLLHSWIPYRIAGWIARRHAADRNAGLAIDRTLVPTFAVIAGLLVFPLCWLPWALLAWSHFGGWGLAAFLVTVVPTALAARWSLHVLGRRATRLLDAVLAAARPHAIDALKRERAWLWGEIDRWRSIHLGPDGSSHLGADAPVGDARDAT